LVSKPGDRGNGSRSSFDGAIERGKEVALDVDGIALRAYAGETVAAAMIAAGIQTFRRSAKGQLRGLYCGMGVCYECLVNVDGQPNVRACMTYATDGMTIERPGVGPSATTACTEGVQQ
jgi:predicted molibdopterin-dependent oxidoreductase YjgC